MKECQKCGSLNKEYNKFCIRCGSKINEKSLFCINCGKEITAQSRFCKYCGKKINADLHSKKLTQVSKIPAQPVNAGPTSQLSALEKQSQLALPKNKKKKSGKVALLTSSAVIVFFILIFAALMIASLFKTVNVSFLNFSIDSGRFIKNFELASPFDKKNGYALSADQDKLLKSFGYPDEFITFFNDTDNGARSDTWTYTFLQKSFFFFNGQYKGSCAYIGDESKAGQGYLKPESFAYKMHPLQVNYIMGENGDEIIDKSNKKRYLFFDESKLVFIFNNNDYLIGVLKLSKPFYGSNG